MSRGPGKVEWTIEDAFLAHPEYRFSIYNLCQVAYPGIQVVEKNTA